MTIYQRIIKAAELAEDGYTVRAIAQTLGVSKTTIHLDLTERLGVIDQGRAAKIAEGLKMRFETKHVNGGEATRLKYQ
jgi:putative DeoR family transcriptional regulator (stage III sporulation protein D)